MLALSVLVTVTIQHLGHGQRTTPSYSMNLTGVEINIGLAKVWHQQGQIFSLSTKSQYLNLGHSVAQQVHCLLLHGVVLRERC